MTEREREQEAVTEGEQGDERIERGEELKDLDLPKAETEQVRGGKMLYDTAQSVIRKQGG